MAIGTTAAILSGLALSAGSSVAQGAMGSKAAKKAAQTQANASGQVVDMVDQTVPKAQAGIGEAVANAQSGVAGAAHNAAAGVSNATGAAASAVEQAAQQAQQGMAGAVEGGNQVLRQVYDDATGTMQPYVQLGNGAVMKLSDLVNSGELTKDFAFSEDDPSYQWRLQQGQQAVERSAAARGGLNSGATLKALTRYAQGAASQEYQAAFDRFHTSRGQKFSMLSGLAGLGKSAGDSVIGAGQNYGNQVNRNLIGGAEYAGNVGMNGANAAGQFRVGGAQYAGNAGMNAAEYSGNAGIRGAESQGTLSMQGLQIKGNALTDKANAQAAGIVGSSNAWGSALGGATNAVGTGLMLGSLGRGGQMNGGGGNPNHWQMELLSRAG